MTHQSIFFIGNLVQVIDHDEQPSERATFVITDIQSSRYSLAAQDKRLYEPLWVRGNEIILIKSSKLS